MLSLYFDDLVTYYLCSKFCESRDSVLCNSGASTDTSLNTE